MADGQLDFSVSPDRFKRPTLAGRRSCARWSALYLRVPDLPSLYAAAFHQQIEW